MTQFAPFIVYGAQQRFINSNFPIRGFAAGIGCVAAETMIDGIPIAERNVPQGVTTLLGPRRASAAFLKGRADLYRVKTRYGSAVTTLHHRFLTPGGWRSLSGLRLGNLVAVDGTDGRCDLAPTALRWAPLDSVTHHRYGDFYDLHVPHVEHYRAGGIWHHNSGKTLVGVHDLMQRAKPGRLYLVLAPSYPLMAMGVARSLIQHYERYGRLIKFNQSAGAQRATIRTFDPHAIPSEGTADIFLRSTATPDRLRGPNVSGILMDEASLSSRDSFDVALGRLREGSEIGWISMTFTPKGRHHWTYHLFHDKAGAPRPGTFLVHAASRDNPFLAEGFVEMVSGQYGSRLREQELGGLFVEDAGTMFQRAWFKFVDAAPADAKRIRWWDKAATEGGDGACSAGPRMSRDSAGRFYIEDMVRGRWSYHQRNNVIRQTAESDARLYGPAGVEIWLEQEPGSGGKESALISINELAGYPVFAERPTGDKIERAGPLQAQAEAGNVYIVNDQGRGGLDGGGWNEELLSELTYFPFGLKDQVDALSSALTKLSLDFMRPKPRDDHLIAWPPPADRPAAHEAVLAAQPEDVTRELASRRSDLVKYLTSRRW